MTRAEGTDLTTSATRSERRGPCGDGEPAHLVAVANLLNVAPSALYNHVAAKRDVLLLVQDSGLIVQILFRWVLATGPNPVPTHQDPNGRVHERCYVPVNFEHLSSRTIEHLFNIHYSA